MPNKGSSLSGLGWCRADTGELRLAPWISGAEGSGAYPGLVMGTDSDDCETSDEGLNKSFVL